jgi:flagellar motor protein MotB
MSEEAGGGHGGSWLITYCDMITLLMACFIMIITFGSKEQEKYSPKKDSVMDGLGGSGWVGVAMRSMDKESVVWRQRPPLSRISRQGSETPPSYSQAADVLGAEVLKNLAGAKKLGDLSDNYDLDIPVDTLFNSQGQVSDSGKQLLHAIAGNIRDLPYDIFIEASHGSDLPRLIKINQHFAEQEQIFPGRLAIGFKPTRNQQRAPFISFLFLRQPDSRLPSGSAP